MLEQEVGGRGGDVLEVVEYFPLLYIYRFQTFSCLEGALVNSHCLTRILKRGQR